MCELLAPAGNLYKLKIALKYGADAVYVGGESFSLRAAADNFTPGELREGIEYAHSMGKKVYVTANIIAHNSDIEQMRKYFAFLEEIQADAVIISDLGAFALCRLVAPKLQIHVSTQANNTNYMSVKAWADLGAKRVVTARELSLEELREIGRKVKGMCELEVFVHGAMCVSYSGRCLLSNYMTHRDSNRGACSHPCRWKYALMEEKRPGEYFPVFENERGTFIMNSKDLCMISHMGELIESSIASFKIEGRVKSEFYVATVVAAYRRAIDDYKAGKPFDSTLLDEVCKVSHREYDTGFFYEMPPKGEQIFGSSSYIRDYNIAAIVREYDTKTRIARLEQRNKFSVGDEVEVISPLKPYFKQEVKRLWNNEREKIDSAPHAAQTIYMEMEQDVCEDSMLRMRKAENR
ncbi:MAG: U32 family peptidase [Clostridia bacterium]|nr:U32 family peptidase [Clostridia bacterium]